MLCCSNGDLTWFLLLFGIFFGQYMTDGVLLRETLKDADLDKYRYADSSLTVDRTKYSIKILLPKC